MTAEVGVLSPIGVALAADSAVSVGSDAAKIFTSADKLFQLSEDAPVGVMVHGAAAHLNVPWETIIKLYRRDLGTRTFPHLRDYGDHFVQYLAGHPMFPRSSQDQWVKATTVGYLRFFREQLEQRLESEIGARRELHEAEVAEVAERLVAEETAATRQNPFLHGLDDAFEAEIETAYRQLVEDTAPSILGALPIPQEVKNDLLKSVGQILCRERLLRESGVVLAGFGERDYHPRLYELDLRGQACDRPLFKWGVEAEVGYEGQRSDAFVIPFAQTEETRTFIEGVDPRVKLSVLDSAEKLLDGVSKAVLDRIALHDPQLSAEVGAEIAPRLVELKQAFGERLSEKLEVEYTSPIMQMVGSLPKDELGSMAESLVNLSRFRRRVSKDKETVGGPIDVAVITKTDGFIWLKRKHYFRPELNLRHLARYNWGKLGSDGSRREDGKGLPDGERDS